MKKTKNIIALSIFILIFIGISALVCFDTPKSYTPKSDAIIRLYGETHGVKEFYDAEFSAWKECYEKENMRDLFLELPYYTTEFLNIWMQEEEDDILLQIYDDLDGTLSHVPEYLELFRKIKEECPETVFYGTDVGHCYNTTGMRYLSFLEAKNQKDSKQYKLAKENIEQGKEWYEENPNDENWREEKMIANFIRTYDAIGKKNIMGIYGSYHIDLNDTTVMAGALKEHYGDVISCIYVEEEISMQPSYQFGFSYVGVIFLLMLFIPNMIWTKHQPKEYELYVKNENKILLAFERIGEVLVTMTVLIFKDFNVWIFNMDGNGIIVPARIGYLIFALVLMILYEMYWIRYFRSEKMMKDFYSDFAGVPLAGATLPVMAFALLGLYGKNVIMLIAVAILGIGHIGIHRGHYKEIF